MLEPKDLNDTGTMKGTESTCYQEGRKALMNNLIK